ncbi:endonuclease domain-containing protein [Patescibacteria group bacterium]|nr:endonuclease domain-containing protein [Patescibacteria group bacterium]MBU4452907.1 endonuclease domain-containing protein [Patescibacteria group bacterium]MCG2687221.1 endonuclease domain-containing protein [Candidatus Parcubacteria bacterium]
MFIYNRKEYKDRRKNLRINPTPAEIRLWGYISRSQIGYKFRRQHGIGDYIVDFYCSTKKLVVELDGDSHYEKEQQIYDKERTEYLNAFGLTVIRFTNQRIFDDMEGVLEEIQDKLNS